MNITLLIYFFRLWATFQSHFVQRLLIRTFMANSVHFFSPECWHPSGGLPILVYRIPATLSMLCACSCKCSCHICADTVTIFFNYVIRQILLWLYRVICNHISRLLYDLLGYPVFLHLLVKQFYLHRILFYLVTHPWRWLIVLRAFLDVQFALQAASAISILRYRHRRLDLLTNVIDARQCCAWPLLLGVALWYCWCHSCCSLRAFFWGLVDRFRGCLSWLWWRFVHHFSRSPCLHYVWGLSAQSIPFLELRYYQGSAYAVCCTLILR